MRSRRGRCVLGTSVKVAGRFQIGSALELPFADASFDGAWTQHSTMNIADKERLYAEIHRVLPSQ